MRKFLLMGAALAVALAACGTTTEPVEGVVDGPDQSSTTVAETTTSVSSDELSLGDFLGYSDDPEVQQQQAEEQEREIQEMIRSCMAEEGFEYIPQDFSQQAFIFEEFDQEEFVRTQGFGITTWYGNEEGFFPDEEIFDNDPNQVIVEAMTEAEQEAYYQALYGDQAEFEPQIDPETGEEIFEDFGFGSGCDGQAYEAIYGSQNLIFEELGSAFEEMSARIESDPRIVEMQTQWSACMADAGFEFTNQEAMYEWVYTDLQARADEVLGSFYVGDPLEGWTEAEIDAFFEEKTEAEIEAFFREFESQRTDEVDTEALAVLQKEEITLAVADYECSQDFQEIYGTVSEEYEKQFVQENLAKLQEIRAAQGN